jgi:subtilisin family serine protease
VLSTVPGNGYATMSGTSMATPMVTGAVALMLAADPTLTPLAIKQRLIDGADESASLNNRSVSDGELNVNNAVLALSGTDVADEAGAATGRRFRRRFLRAGFGDFTGGFSGFASDRFASDGFASGGSLEAPYMPAADRGFPFAADEEITADWLS